MTLNRYNDVPEFWSCFQEPFGFIHIAFPLPAAQPSMGYERDLPVFGNPRIILKSGKKIPRSLSWAALYFKALPAPLSGMQYKHHCPMVSDRNRSIQEPEWGLGGWGLLMTTCPADDLKEGAGDDEEHVEEGAAHSHEKSSGTLLFH